MGPSNKSAAEKRCGKPGDLALIYN